MKIYEAELEGVSPLSFSKYYSVPSLDKESHGDYEKRTWRERAHYDEKTEEVFIPPMAIKHVLVGAARYTGLQIPGKGKKQYRKYVESGVMVTDPIMLGVKKNELLPDEQYVPSDGQPGGSKRVHKTFPKLNKWSGKVRILVLDETVTKSVLQYFLEQAGAYIGLLRFRPEKNGYYGRFQVVNLQEAAA
jgi:hypothetical protein